MYSHHPVRYSQGRYRQAWSQGLHFKPRYTLPSQWGVQVHSVLFAEVSMYLSCSFLWGLVWCPSASTYLMKLEISIIRHPTTQAQFVSSSADLTAIWLSPLLFIQLWQATELFLLSLGKEMHRVTRSHIWPVSGFNMGTGCMRRWLLCSEMWEAFARRSETRPRQ